MMKPFAYSACSSLEEACALLAGAPGKVLAGGTDLLIELRRPGTSAPGSLVDISRIESLRGIEAVDGAVQIGPLTTHAQVARSALLHTAAGLLATAAGSVGSPQIRNRGTIGGNIMNAAACADTVPALTALEARLVLASTQGERIVPIERFFKEPYVTVARPDEILTRIAFSPLPPGTRGAFIKLGRRNAVAIARLSVAAVVTCESGGRITGARIVPGAAMPVWSRVPGAETMLIGEYPSSSLFASAGRATAEAMIRMTGRRWSTEYKEPVLAVLVRRALEACCTDEKGGRSS